MGVRTILPIGIVGNFILALSWIHVAYLQQETLTAQHLIHHLQLRQLELKLSAVSYYAVRVGGLVYPKQMIGYWYPSHFSHIQWTAAQRMHKKWLGDLWTGLLTNSKITKVNYFLDWKIIIALVLYSATM